MFMQIMTPKNIQELCVKFKNSNASKSSDQNSVSCRNKDSDDGSGKNTFNFLISQLQSQVILLSRNKNQCQL